MKEDLWSPAICHLPFAIQREQACSPSAGSKFVLEHRELQHCVLKERFNAPNASLHSIYFVEVRWPS